MAAPVPGATQVAQKYGLDPNIFRALINQESGGNQAARSPVGAIGYTQLMPGTARGLGVNPNDPAQNLDGGAKYLKQQLDAFGGDYTKALAAYNAGPGAVQKYGGVPPFRETQNYVKAILGAAKNQPASTPGASPAVSSPRTSTRTVGAVDNSQARAQAISAFLGNTASQDPLDFALQIRGLQDTPGTKVTTTTPGTASPSGSSPLSAVRGRAASLDSQKLPYSYGGGHGATTSAPGTPLDCSSAVSKVLGINPRVSGDLAKFGAPGPGKRVTIYANGTHTFMQIDGKFWGTSASNPKGGPGWIDASQISPAYLRGFTVRHPPGQ